ncbi:TolC family protein [Leptospira sp. 201903071]|uniref:TolC family protein n=1 Tax=Leptospira ainazelensis TaxID=2810034 RepID=UPI0019647516|nr:TolC family protein [Leptospira ainazelensis]MBM9498717.1 TolC family protein [Leptospira ainazelensis]
MKSYLGILPILVAFLASPFLGEVRAESVLEFSEVWSKIQTQAPSLKSKALEVQAAEISKDRAKKHWLPKVYADVRSFQTNDPALNFMGKLGQRSATQSDFSTASVRSQPSNYLDTNNQPYTGLNSNTANIFAKDTLNNPGSQTYARGTLGIELPLYEGGAKSSASLIQEKRLSAVHAEEKYIRFREYSNAAVAYQSILLSEENGKIAENLHRKISDFLAQYQIGNRSNLVGFSGSLALKSLQLILDVSKKEQETLRQSAEETLHYLAVDLPADFKPKKNSLLKFVEEYLPLPSEQETGHTPLADAYSAYADGAKESVNSEKSKFLPKIAAYAETYAYDGNRNFANSYNAGVYLQMNLLSPADIGALDEAKVKAEGAKKKSEEIRLREESNFRILVQQEKTLSENLKSIYESVRLQEEQLQVSQKLFRNGTIQAPQLAESFSAMVNLLKMKTASESEYLRIRGELSIFTKRGNSNER